MSLELVGSERDAARARAARERDPLRGDQDGLVVARPRPGAAAGSSTSPPTPPAATPASSTSSRPSGWCCGPPRRATRTCSARSSSASTRGSPAGSRAPRRPEFIREKAMGDPRMKFVPELEEERFQSMVAVPILARAGDVIGVVVLHTEAPREFDEDVLNFLVHTGSLVAGAIENAKLYEETRRRVQALTTLAQLSQDLAGGHPARGPLRRRRPRRPRAAPRRRLPDLPARRRGRRARAGRAPSPADATEPRPRPGRRRPGARADRAGERRRAQRAAQGRAGPVARRRRATRCWSRRWWPATSSSACSAASPATAGSPTRTPSCSARSPTRPRSG